MPGRGHAGAHSIDALRFAALVATAQRHDEHLQSVHQNDVPNREIRRLAPTPVLELLTNCAKSARQSRIRHARADRRTRPGGSIQRIAGPRVVQPHPRQLAAQTKPRTAPTPVGPETMSAPSRRRASG